MEAEDISAPGSIEPSEASSMLDPPEASADAEDTSPVVAPVPDWDAPDEDLAAEGDSPPDSLLDEPIPREQQPGILRVSHSLDLVQLLSRPACSLVRPSKTAWSIREAVKRSDMSWCNRANFLSCPIVSEV